MVSFQKERQTSAEPLRQMREVLADLNHAGQKGYKRSLW